MFYSTPETGAGKNLTPDGMTHVPESGAEFIWRRFLDMCHGLKAQNCLFALMCHCTKRTSQHADNIMNSSGDNVRFTANMIGGVRGTLPPPVIHWKFPVCRLRTVAPDRLCLQTVRRVRYVFSLDRRRSRRPIY